MLKMVAFGVHRRLSARFHTAGFESIAAARRMIRSKMLLGLCLKRMDGSFDNRITASDDVSSRQMGRDIGLDTNTDELATVCETVVFSADPRDTAAG